MADESAMVPLPVEYTPTEMMIETHQAGFDAFWSSFKSAEDDIILISSHGRYEFPLDSNVAAEISYVVPPNTYVIETLDVGRLCSTTIDKPLWNLLQPTNRDKLIALLKEKNVTIASPHLDGIINYSNRVIEPIEYILVLKTFIIYLPGMVVAKRRLLFGDDVFFSESKIHYKLGYRGFGVYHFPPEYKEGAAFPKAKNVVLEQASASGQDIQLRNIENFFYKNAVAKKNLFKRMMRSAPHVTNEDVVKHIVTDEQPRIILFSSCGEYYTPTDISKRNNAMRAIQLQRDAIYNTINAGYTQFLFRKPIVCNFAPNKYFNYVLEKSNSEDFDNNNENNDPFKNIRKKTTKDKKFVKNYRKQFFQKKENYEAELMFEAQDFDIDLYKNLLTPLEHIAFDESLNDDTMKSDFNTLKDSIKGNEKYRKLYIDFLAHRAEVWYENLVIYVMDADNSNVFDNAYLIALINKIEKLDNEIKTMNAANVEQINKKTSEKQELNDILENVNLHIQMICWTLTLKNQIATNMDELLPLFAKFRTEALVNRAEKKAIANAKEVERAEKKAIANAIKAAEIKAKREAERAAALALTAQKPARPTRTVATPTIRTVVPQLTLRTSVRAKPKPAATGKKSIGGKYRKTQKNLKRASTFKRHNRSHN